MRDLEAFLVELNDKEFIDKQVGRILASGVLGRSRFYVALLEYLRDCSRRDHAPKEIEIAADVFNRGKDFDPSQDSMVRVYAHNLRQKLEQYYAEHEKSTRRIAIPKGEYRITVVDSVPQAPLPVQTGREETRTGFRGIALAVVAGVVAGFLLGLIGGDATESSAYAEVAESALWSGIADDDLPITLAVGDYYIFGERDVYGNIVRMVREFDINSSRDLDDRFLLDPEAADLYMDLDLTYLPTSMAFAMHDLMQVLAAMDREIRVVPISQLDTLTLRESHIVYIGYLSGLGMLSDFVFAKSALAIGETYDELVQLATGDVFISEAGLPSGPSSYRDYGLFSVVPGPSGNQFVTVAGMRDEGLMQTARAVSTGPLAAESIDVLADDSGSLPVTFEILYEVEGLERTNLNDTIVHAQALDY